MKKKTERKRKEEKKEGEEKIKRKKKESKESLNPIQRQKVAIGNLSEGQTISKTSFTVHFYPYFKFTFFLFCLIFSLIIWYFIHYGA